MDNETLREALPWAEKPVWRGIDCGPGWTELIYKLHQDLAALYPDYKVLQVKEKFGGLRYYVEGVPYIERTDHTDDCELINDPDRRWCFCPSTPTQGAELISQAEEESFRTCEECSTTEGVTTEGPGWIRTLCPKDRAAIEEKRNANLQAAIKNAED